MLVIRNALAIVFLIIGAPHINYHEGKGFGDDIKGYKSRK